MRTRHASADPDIQIEHSKTRQFRWFNVMMIIAMSLGSLGYGCSASIMGTTMAQPYFISYFELDTRRNGTPLKAATTGLYMAGGFIGCFLITPIADKWGRKMGIALASATVAISSALLCGSVHFGMFMAMRFINGVGAFCLLLVIPVWMAEVAPPSVRGAMGVSHGISLSIGYCISQWLGYGFLHVKSNLAWRIPLLVQCFPLIALLLMIYWIPESPRYLLMKDRPEDAATVLHKLHNEEEATIELEQIRNQIAIDSRLDSSWRRIATKPSYRKRAIIAVILASSTQMVGALVINNYGPSIYGGLHYDKESQFIFHACSTMAGTVMSPFAVWIVDRVPRNKLMAISEANNVHGLRAAVSMMFIFFAAFNGGVDCTLWPYLGEIFPTHLRVKGMALAVASITLTDVVWLQAAPTALENIGWKFYMCFICPAILMSLWIYFFAPDTWGVPLEEVAAMFGDRDELYYADEHVEKNDEETEKEAVLVEHLHSTV
ncbi:hypothetical protein SAPIO_CDS6731 [Scedosporium apiospermum]|uniref:Major facilitator superfamily (MFS) profile domain-containing protein n=1 Tax=Pseudallescheria apiosperma TaxID=563466 RepID=A0A084G344_PSEDA|nr:uncharacterized protein SAPIO_CDS6731 [Scedosporium apiospermum]KEZ41756.1 hypothetical protein SAPIO_CDS6731 [Scedosporium apiospermum]